MKRRDFLLALAAASGAAWWLKPHDRGAPHDAYFSALQLQLKQLGSARPLLVIDRQRLAENCATLVDGLPANQQLRLVAKSLPGIELIRETMRHTGSQRLMVFHQPFINAIVAHEPQADILLGKPMPVAAAAQFYHQLPADSRFDPTQQLQWLIDTEQRLQQYLELANRLKQTLRINIEIDVGLHRGGLQSPLQLDALLEIIRRHPQQLTFSGLMGYDAHVGKLPALLESTAASFGKANAIYRAFIERIRQQHRDLFHSGLVFNGAGSPTFRLHDSDSPLTEVSVGSALLKPLDFDLPTLKDFHPAAFIATPVLKKIHGLTLPGPLPLGALWQQWDHNRATTLFIYGGNWLAEPVSPTGLSANRLYGISSNQMMFNGSPSQQIEVDDQVFFRPTQSEAVLLQFGDMLALNADGTANWWAPLEAGHGR